MQVLKTDDFPWGCSNPLKCLGTLSYTSLNKSYFHPDVRSHHLHSFLFLTKSLELASPLQTFWIVLGGNIPQLGRDYKPVPHLYIHGARGTTASTPSLCSLQMGPLSMNAYLQYQAAAGANEKTGSIQQCFECGTHIIIDSAVIQWTCHNDDFYHVLTTADKGVHCGCVNHQFHLILRRRIQYLTISLSDNVTTRFYSRNLFQAILCAHWSFIAPREEMLDL